MNPILKLLFPLCFLLAAVGCSSWSEPVVKSEDIPDIFPDYAGVTVPCNIAPLNFMIEDADRVQASFRLGGKEILRVIGKQGIIKIPLVKWTEMLEMSKGGSLEVSVSVWNAVFNDGVEYAPFMINISSDEIDPWVAYRLIEPGYRSWRQLGLYQRNLTSFEENAIVTNATENETCLNCHHFPSYSSGSMMFHARGANGGTILYHDGKLDKIDFKSIGPKKNTTYPAWHPDGRYIAFSSNSTHQIFYVHGQQPIEVYDDMSDLLVYDTYTGDVITDERFMTAETLESFPAWSPDGDFLYYVSADAKPVPDNVREIQYHIMRVPFDSESRTFGEVTDTVYNAFSHGGSASYPRVSPDGKHLVYTWSEYGTFPIWHNDADLRMIDLETMEHVDISCWNDPDSADSYHSWSSNGRWVVFGSRRSDGRYTRLYLAYFDGAGIVHRPFLLPQEDPRYNLWRLKSFNVPEFIDGEVSLPDEVLELFKTEKKRIL